MKREIQLFSTMTIEDKIMVHSLAGQPFAGQTAITELLKGPVDWKRLIRKAREHSVKHYVYHTLRGINNGLVLPEVLQELKNSCLIEYTRNLTLSFELSKIMKEFNKEAIKNLLLKGAFLDERIYAQHGFRPYTDIDILVHESELAQAARSLKKLGYRQKTSNLKLSEQEGRTQLFFEKPNTLVVDLHWQVINNNWYPSLSRYLNDAVWENTQFTNLNGNRIRTMHHEELLIYQCIHLSVHHNFQKLIWFKDIDEVLHYAESIDWEQFVNIVKEYHIASYCYYALFFTKTLLNSPIPEYVLNELRPQFLTAKVFEFFLRKENLMEISKDGRGRAQQTWMLLRDDYWERLGALRWRSFPSIKWFLFYYPFLPQIKEICYYPFYPVLMFLRLIRQPFDKADTRIGG